MKKSNRRPLAVVKVRLIRKIGDFILAMRTYVLNIGNNPTIFTAPVPALATVTTGIDELETAEALAKTRVQGAAAARDLKYDKSLDDLNSMLAYVQNLADLSKDTATAISIIEAAGFGVKNRGVRVKPPLEAKQGEISGTVKLIAKAAGKRASYNWRKSPDGTAWTELPPTLQAKTSVNGFVPGSAAYFSYQPVLKTGPENWSATVSIMVV
ncbi:MAG TPA: hypothetical protein VJY62_13605 [Bacteroidia bacterium]|nr:hypothetical protein [Bacteroidia bacterium]